MKSFRDHVANPPKASLSSLVAAQNTELERLTNNFKVYKSEYPDGRWQGFWGMWCLDEKRYRDLRIDHTGHDIHAEWVEDGVTYYFEGRLSESMMVLEGASIYNKATGKFIRPVTMKMGAGFNAITMNFDWKYNYPKGSYPRTLTRAKPMIVAIYTVNECDVDVTMAVADRLCSLFGGTAFAAPKPTTHRATARDLFLKDDCLYYSLADRNAVSGDSTMVSLAQTARALMAEMETSCGNTTAEASHVTTNTTRTSNNSAAAETESATERLQRVEWVMTLDEVLKTVDTGKIAVLYVTAQQALQLMTRRVLVQYIHTHVAEFGDNAGELKAMTATNDCVSVIDEYVDSAEATALRIAALFGVKM